MRQSPKRIRLHIGALCAALVLVAMTPAAFATGSMTITFSASEVVVDGVTGGHPVFVFGIGIGSHGRSALLTRYVQTLTDDDEDGQISVYYRGLPQRSVWVVVDSVTGEYVVETPSGNAPSVLSVAGDAWRGDRVSIDVDRAYLEVLVVRPGVGAWTLRTADGGANDSDGLSNAVATLSLAGMQQLAGEENDPGAVISGDVIVMIDPQNLDTFVSEAE
jgi:hypothetical protein